MRHILLAMDGSDHSKEAISFAKTYLEMWKEARMTILYVTDHGMYAYDLIRDVVDRIEKEQTENIKKYAFEYLEEFKDRVCFKHEIGHSSSLIVEASEQEKSDLVIVGSHGRGFLNRAIIGSVAHGVV